MGDGRRGRKPPFALRGAALLDKIQTLRRPPNSLTRKAIEERLGVSKSTVTDALRKKAEG